MTFLPFFVASRSYIMTPILFLSPALSTPPIAAQLEYSDIGWKNTRTPETLCSPLSLLICTTPSTFSITFAHTACHHFITQLHLQCSTPQNSTEEQGFAQLSLLLPPRWCVIEPHARQKPYHARCSTLSSHPQEEKQRTTPTHMKTLERSRASPSSPSSTS